MQNDSRKQIIIKGAREHNLKGFDLALERGEITVITGVSGSGKSTLAFDIILAEANRRFFYTLSQYTRQFLDLGARPAIGSITGLSPAIALAQKETQPSRRATVGSSTDVNELLGVLFSQFGEKHCPEHFLPTTSQNIDAIAMGLQVRHEGAMIGIAAPIAVKKKGNFRQKFSQLSQKGYTKAYIDGSIGEIRPDLTLDRETKHDISIIIDYVRVKPDRKDRLIRALQLAFDLGGGVADHFVSDSSGEILSAFHKTSIIDGCPTCGYSWPKLDARYFSSNSLGKCASCEGTGFFDQGGELEERFSEACLSCQGTGLDRNLKGITFCGRDPLSIQNLYITDVLDILTQRKNIEPSPVVRRLLVEICSLLRRLKSVGLGYLNLGRRLLSLSGGEYQRLRLASVLAENLRGVLYILDEPSQGLSDSEIDKLWETIQKLKQQGNTIIIVDHDESVISRADWIVDLGPGGGQQGGELLAKFNPQDAGRYRLCSSTAAYLSKSQAKKVPHEQNPLIADKKFISIIKPHLHNLVMDKVRVPINCLTTVCGVSGAGKNSLVVGVLYRNLVRTLAGNFEVKNVQRIDGIDQFDQVDLITRKPLAKSSVSMPATYLDIFTELRKLYAKLPFSQISGFGIKHFSLASEGGRCPDCKGKGYRLLTMKFLADSKIVCDSCTGARYKLETLMAKYREKSIAEVLDMSISEAIEHFSSFHRIVKKLQPAEDLGLGYLRLGQPISSLSGGESQRLKLALGFRKSTVERQLIILDEPTTGLHFSDVERLYKQIRNLISRGATIVVIEHSLFFIRNSDWLIKVGPQSAQQGGDLVYEGEPRNFLK